MTELFRKQLKFGKMLPRLLVYIEQLGYLYTLGQTVRCKDCKKGHKYSLHKKALAVDINLFDQEGRYLQNGFEHQALHDFWDEIGEGEAAERLLHDLNHYSVAYKGMR